MQNNSSNKNSNKIILLGEKNVGKTSIFSMIFTNIYPSETNYFESKEAAILVLFLYGQYENKIIDDKTFLLFLDALISFSFRSLICNTTGLSKQFAALMAQKLDAICEKPLMKYDLMSGNYKPYIEKFWDELTSGKGSYSFG